MRKGSLGAGEPGQPGACRTALERAAPAHPPRRLQLRRHQGMLALTEMPPGRGWVAPKPQRLEEPARVLRLWLSDQQPRGFAALVYLVPRVLQRRFSKGLQRPLPQGSSSVL